MNNIENWREHLITKHDSKLINWTEQLIVSVGRWDFSQFKWTVNRIFPTFPSRRLSLIFSFIISLDKRRRKKALNDNDLAPKLNWCKEDKSFSSFFILCLLRSSPRRVDHFHDVQCVKFKSEGERVRRCEEWGGVLTCSAPKSRQYFQTEPLI